MKIIRNDIIPFKGFKAINLFGILFVRNGANMTEQDYNHEAIHTAQMKELWYVGFYLTYLIEWLCGLCEGMSSQKAYEQISFEVEAYGKQWDLNYLKTRKPFAQWQ